MLTSQKTRTVTLRRARFARTFSLLVAVICGACLVFFLVTLPGVPALFTAPALGLVFSLLRAVTWQRAIVRALTRPDEYRWRP